MENGYCRLWQFATSEVLPMRCRTNRIDTGENGFWWKGEEGEIERRIGIDGKEINRRESGPPEFSLTV